MSAGFWIGWISCVCVAGELRYGVLQNTPGRAGDLREAGAELAIVELGWDRAQPVRGTFSDRVFEETRREIQEWRKAGFGVVLDLGLQYPPDWVFDLPDSRFVNQYGAEFRTDTVGADLPDAVFNPQVRAAQAHYVAEVFRRLGSDFALVRLGWMKYSELAYPVSDYGGKTNCYWAYSRIAQGGADGLPEGIPPCPVPGWVPGTADGRAGAFLEWVLEALRNYHDWQIDTVRAHTRAPLGMLYPSWGTRPGDVQRAVAGNLDGSSARERTGEVQRGLDFARFIRGIQDPKVVVVCTWLDSDPAFSDDASADRTKWSPSRYLSVLAAEHRLTFWAENTGGGGMEVLRLCAERIRRYGVAGFFWAFEKDLFDGEQPEVVDLKVLESRR